MRSIDALEHVRPGGRRRWVRTAVLVGIVGYVLGAAVSWAGEPGQLAPRIPEILVLVVGLVALRMIRHGWVRAAGLVFLSAIFAEMHFAIFLNGVATAALVVAPVLVLFFGMFLGGRAALGIGALSLALVVAAAAVDPVTPGFTLAEVDQVVFYGIAVAATATLTSLGMRLYSEVAAEAERSRERAEDVVREAPDGILLVGAEGRILTANPAASDLLTSDGELEGRRLDEVGLELDGDSDGPRRIALAGREERWVEVVSRTLPSARWPERSQIMVRDVSEQVRAQARERLRIDQLHRSQRLAVVGSLAGGIAHAFNNLFTTIRGSAELLRLEGSAELQPHVDEIFTAEVRGETLVRRLLVVARQTGTRPEVFSPGADLRELEMLLRTLLGDGYPLSLTVADTPPIQLERAAFAEAVVSLVDNARDASPGGGAVTIDLTPIHEDDRDWVRLTVADAGEGMDAEVLARAFDPFFTTREIGRAGLGLSAVHAIVADAGGTIRVDSEPGAGTSVHLLWPAVTEGTGGVVAGSSSSLP